MTGKEAHESAGDRYVALSSVMAEVLENLDEEITASGARFQFGDLPSVRGRRAELRQLFVNLIDHAIRHRNGSESPLVQVDAAPTVAGLEVRVRGSGAGIDGGVSEKLFSPVEGAGNVPITGDSLALLICRRIVETLGGSIRAESLPGTGTTFIIHFPVPADSRGIS